jgi:tetratricopeptide (TPR) repeat protein
MLTYRTTEGDELWVSRQDQTLVLTLIAGHQFEAGVTDGFNIGFLPQTLMAAVSQLTTGHPFETSDKGCRLSLSDGRLLFRLRHRYLEHEVFDAGLSREDTDDLLTALRSVAIGQWAAINPPSHLGASVGRNEPCPCGSGRKYKKCCIGKSTSRPPVPDAIRAIRDPVVQELVEASDESSDVLNDSGYWVDLAQAVGSLGHHEESLACFDRALDLRPRWSPAQAGRAVALNEMGKTAEALALIRSVARGSTRRAVIEANILMEAGRRAEAVPLYEEAIAEEPDFFLPYQRLIDALDETDRTVVDYWIERAHRAHPTQPIIAWHYCKLLLRAGRLLELVDANWVDGLRSEAGRLDIVGRADGDEIYIAWAKLLKAAGTLLIRPDLSATESAVCDLGRLPTDGRACEPAFVLATVAAQLGQPDLAARAYGSVCQGCKNGERAPCTEEGMRALAFMGAEDHARAVLSCENSLRAFPDDTKTLAAYWWCLDEIGRADDAVAAAEKLLFLRPATPHLQYNLGFLCGKAGLFGRAVHYYKSEIESQPANWRALENLAVIYLLERKYGDAEEVWERYERAFAESRELKKWIEVHRDDGEPVPLDEVDISHVMQEAVRLKRERFDALATWSKNYEGFAHALDLIRENGADSTLRVGAYMRVGSPMFSVADVMAVLNSSDPLRHEDARHAFEMIQRGDSSSLIAECEREIPRWRELPGVAQSSFLEAEKRLRDTGLDYAPAVAFFAKSVEVALREEVFVPFADSMRSAPEAESMVAFARLPDRERTREQQKASALAFFVTGRGHLELGVMHRALQLVSGDTAKKVPLVAAFREYVTAAPRTRQWLRADSLVAVEKLARDYRNPAVHEQRFSREVASEARYLAVLLLGQAAEVSAQN